MKISEIISVACPTGKEKDLIQHLQEKGFNVIKIDVNVQLPIVPFVTVKLENGEA